MIVALTFIPAYIQAQEFDNSENVYQIDQIITSNEGLFLNINDTWIGAEGILAMPGNFMLLENGKWVSLEEVMNCDSYRTWRCRVCGYINPQGIIRCLNYKNHPK